jgi:CO/xanthine dehydrogenase Mo-binding subunit
MPKTTARPRAPKSAVVHRTTSVGTDVPRVEAGDKLTGRALYVDDVKVPGVLHGRTVRTTIARGRIRSVTLDPAFDWSGVVVVDHRDVPGENAIAHLVADQPALAHDVVHHAEEPILLVAAETAERAEAAAHAVRVEYDVLEPVLTLEHSIARRAVIHGTDNVLKEITIARGDLDRGFAEADEVVEGVYRTGHQEHVYIEGNGMIAERTADGGIAVRGSLQCPYYVQHSLTRVFGLPPEKVRVTQLTTGGGFGGKEDYPSIIAAHAALLAWKSGRPVKIVYDRAEDIAATTKRHPSEVRIRAGVKRDGTLTAFEAEVLMDGGAFVTLSPVVLSRGALHAMGPYRCDNARVHARAMATNTPPNGAFRGFGAPQTLFAAECHMDRIAAVLGMDPVALRRRNALREGDVTHTGQTMKLSVATHAVLEAAVKRVNWGAARRRIEQRNSAAATAEGRGRVTPGARRLRRGLGLSLVHHGAGFTGSGEVFLSSLAAMDVLPDGRPRVLVANTEIGQGATTIFSQIAGEALGVPSTVVVVERPDTAHVPNSGPTVASRTTMVVGGLVQQCAEEMRRRLELFAERAYDGAADFKGVARRFLKDRGALRVEVRYQPPPGIVWDDQHYRGDAYGCFAYECCVVEVEVDLDTGETRVVDTWVAADIGTVIHPLLAAGQVEGGTLQGLGWALLEELRWKDGRIQNASLTNYIIPTAADASPMHVEFVPAPYAHGAFGAKGVGELPMDAPAPAVLSAIAHATGARLDTIPATPERVLRALAARGAR